ncbi:tRNA/rRNA methyltransferase (SpoU), partial [gut metagenome]
IYAADARGGEDLFMTDDRYTQGPVTWLMGAEGPGVSDAGLAASDRRFYIPIEAACESLNVGAAAAVCLFDTRRRRLQAR